MGPPIDTQQENLKAAAHVGIGEMLRHEYEAMTRETMPGYLTAPSEALTHAERYTDAIRGTRARTRFGRKAKRASSSDPPTKKAPTCFGDRTHTSIVKHG